MLLALPPEEQERFMEENHVVDGEEKSVIDMTSRELEKAVKEGRGPARGGGGPGGRGDGGSEPGQDGSGHDGPQKLHQAAQAAEAQAGKL